MKVTLISFDFPQYCIRLANALARQTALQLLLPYHLAARHMAHIHSAIHFQPFRMPRLRQPLRQIVTTVALVQAIKRFEPDVIHFQHRHLWFNLALPLLRRYPLVISLHDPRTHAGDKDGQKTPQRIADFGYRRADRVIVHGEQLKRRVVDVLHIPGAKVHVVPAVPDIVLGQGADQDQAQQDDPRILFFGRIWEYKGLEYLIRAEPLITAQVPGAKIVIAGQGEDFSRYRRMMTHPENFVVYNEFVPDDQLVELFRRASLVVLPYIDGSISGVVPIACTFAKPIVATSVGILPEMVDHERMGYIVPPRDERALADAIVRILQNRALRHQLGANSRRKVETVFDPEVVARQTIAVYQSAIDGVHARAGSSDSRRSWTDLSSR